MAAQPRDRGDALRAARHRRARFRLHDLPRQRCNRSPHRLVAPVPRLRVPHAVRRRRWIVLAQPLPGAAAAQHRRQPVVAAQRH